MTGAHGQPERLVGEGPPQPRDDLSADLGYDCFSCLWQQALPPAACRHRPSELSRAEKTI